MFKFPLKRQQNNNNNNNNNNNGSSNNSSNHRNTKSASSPSNEGFIFIRCGHNQLNSPSSQNILNSINNSNNNINSNSNSNRKSTSCSSNNSSNIFAKSKNSNSRSRSNSISGTNSNSNYVGNNTVQSSWRPQLPLPKEIQPSNDKINQQSSHLLPHSQHQQDDDIDQIQIIECDMDRFHMSKKDPSLNASQQPNASSNNNSSKKWSFGRLFRRGKKEIESESSSEDDRKAGFSPAQKYQRNSNATPSSSKHSKSKTSSTSGKHRSGKLVSDGFDHIVVTPLSGNSSSTVISPFDNQHIDNEFFLPVETVSPLGSQEPFYQNHYKPSQPSDHPQRLHQSQQYLPEVPQTQQQLMSRSAHSLDRRASKLKQRHLQKTAHCPQDVIVGSSSEEEIISLNSSTFSKYRSDESIHSGGQGHNSGQSRRSRAARNERYYKRLSRDGEVSHGQVPAMVAPPTTQKWKSQPVPLSIYQAPSQRQSHQQPQPQIRSAADSVQYSKLRNTSSLQHMAPYVQWGQHRQQQTKNFQNSVNDAKRSISYDSHIHMQNANGKLQTKPLPPPPPPRDPLRRVNVSGHMPDGSSTDLRPVSYAFDQPGVPVLPASGLSGRCVSDDKIWAQQQPQYQSIHSLNITPSQVNSQNQHQSRRFITRAERDAHPGKKSLPNGLDFHYVADATPRSRKPIHMLDQIQSAYTDELEEPPPTGVLRTTKSGLPTSPTKVNATDFWKRMEGTTNKTFTPTPAPRGRDLQRSAVGSSIKPRSISSSHAEKLRAYPMPMYSEVYKPNKSKASLQQRSGSPHPEKERDEIDSVVCGSLHIKPAKDKTANFVEIRNKDGNKSQSMPDHYQRRSGEIPTTPNKYEEYVNERREQYHNAPQPPIRKLSGVPNIPQFSFPRKKPANLEEAINELEAIYRSLGLTEPEAETEIPKKERVPTPNDFEKFALAHADEYDEEDSPAGEPDPVRDDVAYRNIKLANLQNKITEKQPPFGIPVGPIVPAAQSDYLHVTPKQITEYSNMDLKAPDVIKDDLAVRALRKDPVLPKTERYQYPTGSMLKKNRATRTQSANIYALIQRDAAKPSGGDLLSYLELTKSIDRSGSLSDIHKKDSASDVPSTLKLLQSLNEQEREQNRCQHMKKMQIPFRHPSQGGAICQLPEKLSSSEEKMQQKPTPMPRKSLTPEPKSCETHKMEEALNKIAQDAQASSIKLTQELNELRKEALITHSKPKRLNSQEEKLELELQEIEKVSQAAKQCGKMLLDNLPDCTEPEQDINKIPRKLHKEDKLIKAIDQVSEAANKVCEKILKDIVTTEPPVVVQEAVSVKLQPQPAEEIKKDTLSSLVTPSLIKKLDPIQSDKIEAIARRCMRQLSDLAENHDYDNLNQPEITVASTCNLEDNTNIVTPNELSTSNLTESHKSFVTTKPKQVIEDIDQIMKECEDQARRQETVQAEKVAQAKKTCVSSATASSFSSSSDCLAKSSSPSASRRFSSSITSFNPYSSSDYIKSPSSDFHAPSTDRIKSCSTTSYDVQSTTSATPNVTTTTNSNFSGSPSPPPLNLTPVSNCSATLACSPPRARSSSPSQYNSSEELAMIFGIEERTKAIRNQKLQKHSGNMETPTSAYDIRMPEQELQLTAASPSHLYTATECCSKTNPNECCLLNLSSSRSPSPITNTNASSPQHFSSSVSPSSTFRLETIPELDNTSNRKENRVSLSPHNNRIYASKVRVFVDKSREEPYHRSQITQFDSMSSLEETSSNPDSGNVSLADFPLSSFSNNSSLHHPSFVSRIEVKNSFRTEIAIRTEEFDKSLNTRRNNIHEELGEEFPPLPTDKELKDSLKESNVADMEVGPEEDLIEVQKVEKKIFGRREQDLLGKRIRQATEEIMAEVKALQASSVFAKEQLNVDTESGKSIIGFKGTGEGFDIADCFEGELSDLFEETDTPNKSTIDESEGSDVEDFTQSEKYTSLQADLGEYLEIPDSPIPQRKRSVVFETPLLEMNIMEEKINYEININAEQNNVLGSEKIARNCYELQAAAENPSEEDQEQKPRFSVLSLQEICLNCYLKSNADMDEKIHADRHECTEETTKKKVDQSKQPSIRMKNEMPATGNQEESDLRLRPWYPLSPMQVSQWDESPSTSAKASRVVNVFGESRPNAVNGLSLMEHLVVACALGLINTDDPFTLCLIILGIVIIIAIAVF